MKPASHSASTSAGPAAGHKAGPDSGSGRQQPQIVLALLGPTAVGKSSLAMDLARSDSRIELVSADSMQVYRGMDIGTAKPTAAEQAEVKHHLIDTVDAHESYSLSLFVEQVHRSVTDIISRGHLAVMVGGTGLYVQTIVDALELPGQYLDVRAELEGVATAELYERLRGLDPLGASRMEPTNRRRILRALEVCVGSGRPFSSFGPGLDRYAPTPIVQVALDRSRDVLDERIEARYHAQIEAGFVAEVEALLAGDPPVSKTALQALGYKEIRGYLEGETSLEEALELAILRTRRFARRQQRWLRRDPRIIWIDLDTTTREAALGVCVEALRSSEFYRA